MNFYRFFILFILFVSSLSFGLNFAGYWFQFGVRGGDRTISNQGTSVNIQTITNQILNSVSSGYWVGETLSNGAFIQIGYLSENQSGVYPSFCTMSGCGGYENLTAGNDEWFYEYFPPSFSSSFLGKIGPDGSAGKNGTINNYGFYYNGTTWNFLFNGKNIGNVTLGSNSSGQNIPIAFGELANASNSDTVLKDVVFNNLKFYKNGNFLTVPSGYSFIGYGQGSSTVLKNPYGVEEVGNKINYFSLGSGIPQYPNNTRLWTLGYTLSINSTYGNVSGDIGYVAYANAKINVPSMVNINNGTRAIFIKWVGSGLGSYTGVSNYSNIYLNENITETAVWQKQYYLNVFSQYGNTTGSGWYDANSTINYSINSNIIYQNKSSRFIFNGWNNGAKQLYGKILLNSSILLSPIWEQQYYITINSQFGNVSGSGWYFKNSTAVISMKEPIINVTPYEKIAFYSWNNGAKSQNLSLKVLNPLSIMPIYKNQFLTYFEGANQNGIPIFINNITINGNKTKNTLFLYSGLNYTINNVYYDGTTIPLNKNINITSNSTVLLTLPLYNLSIKTTDLFAAPVNALVILTFYNGTTISEYTGNLGSIKLQNVPFGMATGTASYGSITTSINALDGNQNTLLFVSLFNIEVFILIIVISGIIFVIASRRLKHSSNKDIKKETIEKNKKPEQN